MISSRIFPAALRAAAAVILIAAGISCQSIRLSYDGLQVPAENRILLKDAGTHQDIWQADDLTINYTYQRSGASFDISGWIDFSDALKNFNSMDHFDLWIHFVDAENRIIDTRSLFPHLPFHRIEAIPFERRLDLPPNARGFVFSYSGRAVDGAEGDDGGGADWDFWKRPQD
jgi:hypothetical protein